MSQTRSMNSSPIHTPPVTDQLLDSLDKKAGQDPAAVARHAPRQRWRKRLSVRITEAGGRLRIIEVATRNLSSGGCRS